MRHGAPRAYLCGLDHLVHHVSQVPLVLGLVLEPLTAHLDDVLLRVVPGPGELLELQLLGLAEAGQVPGAELHHDLPVGGVDLAHVCCVSEPEDLVFGGRLERLGKFWFAFTLAP
jgi:hypothetical protein